jgi:hypothetical protein
MLGRFFKEEANLSQADKARRRMRHGQELILPKWVFKGHAEEPFWKWVCSWARTLRQPSDLGFSDQDFKLPALEEQQHFVPARSLPPGKLFHVAAVSMNQQLAERRRTIAERCEKVAQLVAGPSPALIWCHLNAEGDLLAKLIPDAVQIAGADSDEEKEERWLGFIDGQIRVIVSKPKIGCWGLNLQHCAHQTTFPSHSFEQYYQAVRRSWRFGQKEKVHVDLVTTEAERDVMGNLKRKQAAADKMFARLIAHMQQALHIDRISDYPETEVVPKWL